jgi:hypothetical protein
METNTKKSNKSKKSFFDGITLKGTIEIISIYIFIKVFGVLGALIIWGSYKITEKGLMKYKPNTPRYLKIIISCLIGAIFGVIYFTTFYPLIMSSPRNS